MFKAILVAAAIGFTGAAQAEIVVLKTKDVYETTSGEKSISFSTKACGIKAIAVGFEGKHNSWARYSQVVASYQTGSDWGVIRDTFNSYNLLTVGEQSKWFELRADAPCLRKIYVTAETNLWPMTQGKYVIYGLK